MFSQKGDKWNVGGGGFLTKKISVFLWKQINLVEKLLSRSHKKATLLYLTLQILDSAI